MGGLRERCFQRKKTERVGVLGVGLSHWKELWVGKGEGQSPEPPELRGWQDHGGGWHLVGWLGLLVGLLVHWQLRGVMQGDWLGEGPGPPQGV